MKKLEVENEQLKKEFARLKSMFDKRIIGLEKAHIHWIASDKGININFRGQTTCDGWEARKKKELTDLETLNKSSIDQSTFNLCQFLNSYDKGIDDTLLKKVARPPINNKD